LVETFARERERYLEAVEPEVVKLALAVAARILRREAQMDPLLLTGAVRVALGQLSSSTQIRLRVPPADLDLWEEAIALLPNLETKPTVLAGEGMRLGDCEIETEMGSVDLGVRAQMAEIERGFFDRAGGRRMEEAARPAVESGQ
jgi:flagellar assembly protein FliH